jgi:hypothetical protein
MSKSARLFFPDQTHSQRKKASLLRSCPITAAALLVGSGCGTDDDQRSPLAQEPSQSELRAKTQLLPDFLSKPARQMASWFLSMAGRLALSAG